MKILKKSNLTLLEVMIGIALIAIASGALLLRLNRMVERKRFDSDVNRFRSTLVTTRSLAINTKMDFRLVLKEGKEGWDASILCREDSDLVYRLPHFSTMKLVFDQKTPPGIFRGFFFQRICRAKRASDFIE